MKSSKSDLLVTLFICTLAAVISFFFWEDLNRSGLFGKGDPLGTIVFKKRSATRRSPTSLNWERLKNHSSVYNRDVIRTADYSEAILLFDDGSEMSLFENTMVKLNFQDELEPLLEFVNGRISMIGATGKSIIAGDRTVSFSDNTLVSFKRNDDKISIEVDGGSAIISDREGNQTTLVPSTEFILNTKSGEERIIQYSVDLRGPAQNSRFISLGSSPQLMEFNWSTEGTISGPLFLEISSSDDFEKSEIFPVKGNTHRKVQSEGTWFWRVVTTSETLSSISRFSLDQEELSHPILPAQEGTFFYRKVPPPVIFSWSPMENAESYVLEISAEDDFNNPIVNFRTTLTSLTLRALDEGEWFWRVTPQLSQDIIGMSPTPELRKLIISKKDEMTPIALFYPVEENLYELKTIEERGLNFSWETHVEAVNYELRVAKESSMSDSIVDVTTNNSFISLNKKNAKNLENEGNYFWAVRWIDIEGNLSPWSVPRPIQGVDKTLALRLSYPPENYTIDRSLILNVRFAWKTNVPGRMKFQLSQDSDFSEIHYEEDVQAETILGKDWGVGKWYWRIRTFNADGTVFLDSPAQSINIVNPLPAPHLLNPPVGQGDYLYMKGDTQKISWSEVQGADIYFLRIFSKDSSVPVIERGLIESEEIELNFDDLPDGDYRFVLQGFAQETKKSTRIIGYLRETVVSLTQLHPLEIITPLNNPSFLGLTALREGVNLQWDGANLPEESELRLYSKKSPRTPIYVEKNPQLRTNIPSLPEGEYFWTISGMLEGFDISANHYGYFTVEPIPKLPRPQVQTPVNGYVIGPEQLQESRKIDFEWVPLEGASHYVVSLYKRGVITVLFSTGLTTDTSYSFEDLSLLEKGDYIWEVHGEYYNEKGQLEQDGLLVTSHFTIDLPDLSHDDLKINTDGVFFGF